MASNKKQTYLFLPTSQRWGVSLVHVWYKISLWVASNGLIYTLNCLEATEKLVWKGKAENNPNGPRKGMSFLLNKQLIDLSPLDGIATSLLIILKVNFMSLFFSMVHTTAVSSSYNFYHGTFVVISIHFLSDLSICYFVIKMISILVKFRVNIVLYIQSIILDYNDIRVVFHHHVHFCFLLRWSIWF